MVTPQLPHRVTDGFDGLYGLEVTDFEDGLVRARVAVRDELKQPAGLVHGGVLCAAAESLASMATYLAVQSDGLTAMGLSNHTSFVRPIVDGTIHVEGRRRHQGRTTWLWEVDFTDDDGRLCATSRVTIAVRQAPAAG